MVLYKDKSKFSMWGKKSISVLSFISGLNLDLGFIFFLASLVHLGKSAASVCGVILYTESSVFLLNNKTPISP